MFIAGQILSQGYVSSSKSPIYISSGSVNTTYIKFFSVYNSGTTTENVVLYVSGSTSTPIARVQLQPSESAHIVEAAALTLKANQIIEAKTDNLNSVEYLISGGTE